jgi:hypothetical protein
MYWKVLLASIIGAVDQELLLRNDYLVTENRLLRQQIAGRIWLTDAERSTRVEIGKKLGKQVLAEVASIVPRGAALGADTDLCCPTLLSCQSRST